MIEEYGSLYWFYILTLVSLPAVVLGLLEKPLRPYARIATVVMVVLLVGWTTKQWMWLVGFLVFELTLAKVWLRYRVGHEHVNPWLARLAAASATLPLVVVKAGNLFPTLSVGFIGISYLSFRVIQVVLETTDGLITALPLADLAFFVLFFPTLASGPIDRLRRYEQDEDRIWTRNEYVYLLGRGIALLLMGAVYKFVLAAWFTTQLEWAVGWPQTLAYMYLYTGRLFFDFAGYSAMAVGTSYIFGIRTPPNFRLPFVSESIKDFWTRWHITLSFWFRDYLYTRIAMYLMRLRIFKGRRVAAGRVALALNMLLMGAWHGFQLHFLLYGLYHGVLLVLNDVYEKKSRLYAYRHRLAYRLVAIAVTFQLVVFSFLIFSGHILSI
ncbi:MAG TPA: D-alanyl-lipoteichoic acid biosynthesis protein DltB [Propionibacteriaceae bacterium]|nr:D-alanyl-lipoteichoic acid biosynthesis protein DltB [Propionibacteriaceae bacterium]